MLKVKFNERIYYFAERSHYDTALLQIERLAVLRASRDKVVDFALTNYSDFAVDLTNRTFVKVRHHFEDLCDELWLKKYGHLQVEEFKLPDGPTRTHITSDGEIHREY